MALAIRSEAKLETTEGCRFCAFGADSAESAWFDRSLLRTKNFSVQVSVGAIVPGWLLITPSYHAPNLIREYTSNEFVGLRQKVSAILASAFRRSVLMFEHGANRDGSLTGCGVNHAHLHLLPLDSLRSHFADCEPGWGAIKSSQIAAEVGNKEYLFYSEDSASDDPNGFLRIVDEPTSQYFRRHVARAARVDDQFDYRKFPFTENMELTTEVLSSTLANSHSF